MLYTSHAPMAPLADFVEYFWALSDAPAHAQERIVPSGTLELVVNLHEDVVRIYDPVDPTRCRRFSGAVVSGAYRSYFVIDTREHASMVGVHFRPGGARAVLGLPPGELADTHVDLETLWGARARRLRERLCSARVPVERFRILEEVLLASLRATPERQRAMHFALERLGGGSNVGDVAAELDLSRRRFIELFTADVGITPKLFSRVRRFQRTLAMAELPPVPDWPQLALECGYFDQSHMIRDFVAFSGFSPAAFLRHRGAPVKEHHVALPGDDG
ncbi:helix-turn-helix domain-containing protein [Pyxidicoccus xibeiensis]|uniref:helix-turn-helix domain-containing protein n=1 Tax=Pyxidicoccus xibeiensis TaxID=2906759 RepID=UPI0020A8345E|nr:helix-turn-helix domain-containing protein [Pyxidicoccus xibeiensis]MCP3143747.1 helix-turn-helix domain-containing protein [Pyxidicoccus xibeiensis]